MSKPFAKRFGEFVAYSVIAVVTIGIIALSLAITWRALTWAFGS